MCRGKTKYLPGIVISIVLIAFCFWPYMWEAEFLNKWASLAAVLSLAGLPATYFLRQGEKEMEVRQKEEAEKNRTCRNLYGELYDTLDAIKGEQYPEDLLDVSLNGNTKITYTHRFLNHDIYDSLIFSGGIKFLKYELQQKTQDIFNMIKRHNRYLEIIIENQEQMGNSDVSKTSEKYFKLLDKYERQLLKLIPKMMDELKGEFDFEPPT